MKRLKQYMKLQQEIYEYFGYEENWRVFPLEDSTDYYWRIDSFGNAVHFAETEEELGNEKNDEEATYTNAILKYRGTPGVYRGADFTMICCDTQTDGNKFLCIFDNTKERKET